MGIISFKKLNCMCSPAIAAKTTGPHSVAREVSLFTRKIRPLRLAIMLAGPRKLIFQNTHQAQRIVEETEISYSMYHLVHAHLEFQYLLRCTCFHVLVLQEIVEYIDARLAWKNIWKMKSAVLRSVDTVGLSRFFFCAELGQQYLQPHMHNIQRRPTGREIS